MKLNACYLSNHPTRPTVSGLLIVYGHSASELVDGTAGPDLKRLQQMASVWGNKNAPHFHPTAVRESYLVMAASGSNSSDPGVNHCLTAIRGSYDGEPLLQSFVYLKFVGPCTPEYSRRLLEQFIIDEAITPSIEKISVPETASDSAAAAGSNRASSQTQAIEAQPVVTAGTRRPFPVSPSETIANYALAIQTLKAENQELRQQLTRQDATICAQQQRIEQLEQAEELSYQVLEEQRFRKKLKVAKEAAIDAFKRQLQRENASPAAAAASTSPMQPPAEVPALFAQSAGRLFALPDSTPAFSSYTPAADPQTWLRYMRSRPGSNGSTS